MLDTPEVVLEQFRGSPQNGFLPAVPPLKRLEDPYYEPWENIVCDLPAYIKDGSIRQKVDCLPVLSTSMLNDEAEWRRAYVVLAYLTHAYVWGGEKPSERLPPAISCPFLDVSSRLELPACATYAAVCLWNFAANNDQTDLTDPDNLCVNTSFTGTKDEEWFFMVSAAIEATGAKLFPIMLNAIHAVNVNDAPTVAASLNRVCEGIQEIAIILQRMFEKCGPSVFFHQIRPFLAGSKNMATAGLPNGVFYDVGDGQGEWRQYSGGSNAQSSLIQTFDIFLGVQHSATGEVKSDAAGQQSGRTGYLQEMRNYMPGPHRRFLEMLTRLSNIRAYAMKQRPGSAVRDAYNTAAMTLGSFRDIHIQLVSRYIIMASKTKPIDDHAKKTNLATATAKHARTTEKHKVSLTGTGGTDLIPFLRRTRDTTKAAANYMDSAVL
ncbi:hypothetical protein SI65_00713 [Aspergillus cristatus]|uniref:Indoleamine 2,3-dioxygenase n=1 Tax=Aspergillus cristatus TaxID=573508 RepID=A0A1E3BQ70_ASPCR|nr:hypothetical protein SI65_00713 [Aspergillus cristatus]